nr:hypothetical protein CTI12_AA323040 [Tanacetum cinerariifolium]
MRASSLFLLCTLLLATSLDIQVFSKGLTQQQLQDSGKAVDVKRVLKVGKGPYGGANIDRDPRKAKNDAPSKLPWSFCTGIGL